MNPYTRLRLEAEKWDMTPEEVLDLALDAMNREMQVPRPLTSWDVVEMIRKQNQEKRSAQLRVVE